MVKGDIETGDDRYFRQALLAADTNDLLVSLESNGGDLAAGIAIGRAIWLSEAATVVEDAECASACALAWLAGRPRYMAPTCRGRLPCAMARHRHQARGEHRRQRRRRRLPSRPGPYLRGDPLHQRAGPGRAALPDVRGCRSPEHRRAAVDVGRRRARRRARAAGGGARGRRRRSGTATTARKWSSCRTEAS